MRHAFTTRQQGSFDAVSAPAGPFGHGRRWPALAALDVDPPTVRYARQVHGVVCLDADAVAGGLVGTGDALFTRQRGRPLAIFTADCVPLIVADPAGSILGMAHAGWRGTVQGIAERLVAALVERAGARADRLTAAIGPSIGPCCYEVDEPVVGPVAGGVPVDVGPLGAPRRAGSPRPLVAGPLDGQRRSAGGGRRASAGDPEPQPLHRLPAGPLLLVPEGGPGGAARDVRRARVRPRGAGRRGVLGTNPLQYARA